MATVSQKRALAVNLKERVNTVTLSCEEYEQLLHRPAAPSATSSSSGVFIMSHVRPTDYLTLTNVLFAPKFPVNLLSVSQLTKTHNCSVTFSPSYSVIQDLQTRRTIGTGHKRGGLYFLDTTPLVDARALFASISPLQWHSRLGHPSLPTLQKILPIHSARLECESCELGKHHRASFPPRVEKRSSSPFTLVHSDIWGPCLFESLHGFRYFITFVDDYSRMTWVYLLRDRPQVPTIITSFYNEIYTQFSVNICILRTDNALEFVQKSVSDFCNSKGILHQTSCPYTSQQNGVAERKHRHLLDVARTIMTHMHVPKSYWGDAVLTACYLINRMPSNVLNGDTPYSCLFPDKPLFGIAPRVFGCVCFVHIHSPSFDKLSPCFVKCIFLGYSQTQKGYRCYDPQSRRSFTSVDVTFFESTPFYSPQSSVVIPPPSVPLPVPTLSVPPLTEPPTRPL
ncbi:UNVERIFIED_CONTAM: Retrovirus-related Pol polyprotein from transposon RE2 [Sesamum radiatum]|uniref:Retrovirus-related Pol polyprotein from transposon RE2 n=1 Tax=Sesamum radiatum TaxID=300843 RepID=A0AAW2LDG4_SESRA